MALDESLYPDLEPTDSGMLPESDGHSVYWEVCGNPDGQPAIVLHGGPGGGCSPLMRRYHDPERYRIVLFDQRGCGRSAPNAALEHNTTWHLVSDMERLREHLGIERWQLFGGSWGSTLALAYLMRHPDRVSSLVLRGIFACRESELRWLYQYGASQLFPDAWESFAAPIPKAERNDMIKAYHERLTGDNAVIRAECARAWGRWESAVSYLHPNPEALTEFDDDAYSDAFARIEAHYFVNRGFFETDRGAFEALPHLQGKAGAIVQGRYDVVTPAAAAWELHKAWPEAQFTIVPDAGHSAKEPGIAKALVAATERLA
ncbi:MAG: prolyl aminopeptidase [Pseudomonadota bacterium]